MILEFSEYAPGIVKKLKFSVTVPPLKAQLMMLTAINKDPFKILKGFRYKAGKNNTFKIKKDDIFPHFFLNNVLNIKGKMGWNNDRNNIEIIFKFRLRFLFIFVYIALVFIVWVLVMPFLISVSASGGGIFYWLAIFSIFIPFIIYFRSTWKRYKLDIDEFISLFQEVFKDTLIEIELA